MTAVSVLSAKARACDPQAGKAFLVSLPMNGRFEPLAAL